MICAVLLKEKRSLCSAHRFQNKQKPHPSWMGLLFSYAGLD
jgi:hypothetical protein